MSPVLPASGKGEARGLEEEGDQGFGIKSNGHLPLKIKVSRRIELQSPATEMPPPPVPPRAVLPGRGSRRATIDAAAAQAKAEIDLDDPGGKGKKRGRLSLPDLSVTRKLRGPLKVVEEPEEIVSAATEVDFDPTDPSPSSAPAPVKLPSLAHLPFPQASTRPRERFIGPRHVWYTDPTQNPFPMTKHSGDIAPIMSSYIQIEDTGPLADVRTLELRAAREAYFRNRVNYLQQQGRLLSLLDEVIDQPRSANKHQKAVVNASRQQDHQDAMMSHMVQVRNAIVNEAKMKPQVCKRVARMVQMHWEHLEGKEDRERAAEERERRRKAKDLGRALKKRWSLAVKVSLWISDYIPGGLKQVRSSEQKCWPHRGWSRIGWARSICRICFRGVRDCSKHKETTSLASAWRRRKMEKTVDWA